MWNESIVACPLQKWMSWSNTSPLPESRSRAQQASEPDQVEQRKMYVVISRAATTTLPISRPTPHPHRCPPTLLPNPKSPTNQSKIDYNLQGSRKSLDLVDDALALLQSLLLALCPEFRVV